MLIEMFLAMAAAAGASTVAAPPPRIAVVVLTANADGERSTARTSFLGSNSAAILFTLHDLGQIAIQDSAQENSDFDKCFTGKRREWEAGAAACIAARITRRGDGVVPLVVLVHDTHSRSSAQQFTCIGANGATGDTRVYLRDLFHPRADIRAGNRRNALACITDALGTRR